MVGVNYLLHGLLLAIFLGNCINSLSETIVHPVIDFKGGSGKEALFQNVNCVLSDMDGTFLKPDHGVSDRNCNAIRQLRNLGIKFFPATGRTRRSMALAGGDSLVKLLGGDLNKIPGVYAQGLVVYGPSGEVISEEFLNADVIEESERFCATNNLSVIAYAGDRILTRKRSFYTDKVSQYAEPIPEEMAIHLHEVHRQGIKINKLIILDDESRLVCIRPCLEEQLLRKATVTRAVPGMLEILPFGSSKGKGVQKLLEHCGINSHHCMAFGDGENDIEMIQLVRYGIAMDNAREELKKVAFGVTLSNSQDGVAHILDMLM